MRQLRAVAFLSLVVVLQACPSTPQPIPLPDGLVATHADEARLSGPVCDKGAHARASLNIHRVNGGTRLRIDLHIDVSNSCLTDSIYGLVTVRLKRHGLIVASVAAQTSEPNPGRGFPWNGDTKRSGHASTELLNPIEYDSVEFEFNNRYHGSPVTSLLQVEPRSLSLIGGGG